MHDVKDYGAVCDLEANPDVVGLAATHQVSFKLFAMGARPSTMCDQLHTLLEIRILVNPDPVLHEGSAESEATALHCLRRLS